MRWCMAERPVDKLPVWVQMLEQTPVEGKVIWLAPAGIDLALVRAPWRPGIAEAAKWERNRPVKVGESAFAIGNPHGLAWTHTVGTISQLRTMPTDVGELRIIQTQAAINPGNSGGGLYDKDGFLIGLNTWANDKRVSEGIGFAISVESLIALAPADLLTVPESR